MPTSLEEGRRKRAERRQNPLMFGACRVLAFLQARGGCKQPIERLAFVPKKLVYGPRRKRRPPELRQPRRAFLVAPRFQLLRQPFALRDGRIELPSIKL